jgi:hypothetical protein
MPPPNKVLQPGDLGQELGDLRRQITALNTAGQPHPLSFNESVDATHPMYLDFVIANGITPAFAKLSFKFRLYRTTSSFAGGTTGQGSAHGHGAHSHSHAHGQNSSSNPSSDSSNAAFQIHTHQYNDPGTGAVTQTSSDATNATPGNESTHTHSVGASSLGVSEGSATTITAIGVDGIDKTALLGGGPWASDTVDLDIAAVLPLGNGLWHYLTLTPASQGRIVAVLRL